MKKFMSVSMLALLAICMLVACMPTIVVQAAESETQYYATEFNGASEFVTKERAVSYESKETLNRAVEVRTPSLVLSGVTCVPNAAMNLIVYYDRFYEDLIPNYTPGFTYSSYYFYNSAIDEYVNVAAEQFIEDMGLTKSDGATVNQFKSGMTKYCERISLTASYTNVMSSRVINYQGVRSQILAGKPAIVFCSKFNIAVITTGTNQDTVTSYISSDAHAMAVFGFTEVTYTMSDGTTQVDKYLRVATGVATKTEGLLYLGSDILIDEAYALSIS